MKSLSLLCRCWLVTLALLTCAQSAQADTDRQRVIVALPVLYALTATLAEGTTIQPVRLPREAAVPMESLGSALARQDARVFQEAAAVVTLGELWRADPLYAAARRHNLRVVDIDASRSWDANKPAVALIRAPANDVPWAGTGADETAWSPYAWLSPAEAVRMAARIADDLARLALPDAPRIARNLAALDSRVRGLKARYGERLAQLPDPRVLSLADEFVYLYSEFGIFVDGWFVRQDVDWRDTDRAALTRYLRERDIRVVVHKWEPDASIVKAIADAGARLVVLDAGNPGVLADASLPYDALLTSNLDALLAAFAAPRPTAAGDVATPPR